MKTAAVVCATVACCACSGNKAPPKPVNDPSAVRVFGSVHAVMEGSGEAVVSLDDGLDGGYGLGALGELRGEFVAVPGEVWVSYPTGGATPDVRRAEHSDETAALLVAATVSAFRPTTVGADVPGEAVEAQIAALAGQAGVDSARPFPFLIQGRLRAVHWHVIDATRVEPGKSHAEASQQGVIDEADATVVGFYSTAHQGIFTMHGQNTHMHFFAPEAGIAGHVDSLELPAGCIVSFP